jgi:TonB-linked SusC/RagA family outer membrane protein
MSCVDVSGAVKNHFNAVKGIEKLQSSNNKNMTLFMNHCPVPYTKRAFKNCMLVMKITTIMITVLALNVSATLYSQSMKLSLDIHDATIKEALQQIESETEFRFIYESGKVDLNRKINIRAMDKTVEDILDQIFRSENIHYVVTEGKLILIDPWTEKTAEKVEPAPIQQGVVVAGTVTDNGEPMPGVNVLVKGTLNGVVTDANGRYAITVPDEQTVLVFSFVGYTSQEIPVGDKTTVDLTMAEDLQAIEEIVVVGYGVQKKATVTGSISTVTTKTLTQSPVANISNSLAGRMSGLFAMQKSGEPGRDQSTLRIRGSGTFSGSSDPLIMVDGIEALSYNNIDPNEIESLSILKDASATAVYGVRGANGVILITTKRGTIGKPVLSISSNFGLTSFSELRKNLRSYEYSQKFNEALRYNSYETGTYTPLFSEEEIELYRNGTDPIFYPDVDWISMLLKPVTTQTQHNINISGGTEVVKYFVSGGYLFQDGLFDNNNAAAGNSNPESKYQRFNIRSNFDFTITKRLTAMINFDASIETSKYPGTETNDNYSRMLVNRIMQAPPYISPGMVDGKLINTRNVQIGNPLERLVTAGFSNRLINNITSTVTLKYELDFITKGLRIHGTVSNWNNMWQQKNVTKNLQTYRPQRIEDGTILFLPEKEDNTWGYWEGFQKNRKTYYEVALNYERTFGDHTVSGLLLYNQDKKYDPELRFQIPQGFQGLVARATYNYKLRYLGEFNIAYNGNENFAPGKRFGMFPSFSLGWVVSEESFFPKNDVISYIKIRGTWGQVGKALDRNEDRFLYMPASYAFGESYNLGIVGSTFQAYQASRESTLGNPLVTWERAEKSDIGIDLSLFDQRLRITADYFYEIRDDILASPGTTPNIVGINLPRQNWGKMENRGYEGEISFSDKAGGVNYWVKGTYTFARNKIIFMDEVPYVNAPYQQRTGQRKGQYYGLIAEGFYNSWEDVNDANRPRSQWDSNYILPGDVKYKDINGDGIINTDDQVPIGYSNEPEIMYGISFGGAFKNFDLSVLFQGVTHVSRRNSGGSIRPFELDLMCTEFIAANAWSPERYANGENILLPRLSARQANDHNYQGNNLFMLQDASYLRLKNLEIGYTFSNKLMQRLNISSCRLYLTGNNLLTWDGLFPGDDPEQDPIEGDYAPYPITRTFNLGVNLRF